MASEEICFQVWLKQHTLTSGLMPFTEKSGFWIPDPQTQENPLTHVEAAGQHVGLGCSCLQVSLPILQQSKVWKDLRHPLLFSACCSAIFDTCRTCKASEYGDWICSETVLGISFPSPAWTPSALEHVEVILSPKTFCPAPDSLHYFPISTHLSRKA